MKANKDGAYILRDFDEATLGANGLTVDANGHSLTVAQNLTRCWLDEGATKVLDIAIANPEREVTFSIGGVAYSLTLTKHRPPKG